MNYPKKLLTLFIILLSCYGLRAEHFFLQKSDPQTGKITGRVLDKNSNDVLIGLTVFIDGTQIGTATNIDGRYELNNLQPGTYKIVFKLLSFNTKIVENVQVDAGKVTSLDVVMEEAVSDLKEVVVSSTFKKESIGSLYSIQKNNISISDGISADVIKKSPDKNTSEVLRRVSGASIQDNRFVIIRGLSDRYNTALLNGAPLPSTEPDKRAFSFDLFPSGLIESMTITKAATPELPGDFAGGVIQLQTRDFPDENFLSIGIGSSYNDISTFKPYYSSKKGKYDFLGFDDGTRALPSGFPESKEYQSLNKKQQLLASKSFTNDWGYEQHASAPLGQSLQLSFGRNDKVLGNNLGSIFALTYTNSQRYQEVLRMDYNADSTRIYDYKDSQYKYGVLWGALANLSYQLNDHHKLSFKNITNTTAEDVTTLRTGINYENDGYIKSYGYQFVSKTMRSHQLSGEHFIPGGDVKIKWLGGYNRILRDEPDYRRLTYKTASTDLNEDSIYYATVPQSSANNQSGKFYSFLNEGGYSGSADASVPFTLFKGKNTVKAGVAWQQRERDFSARVLGYVLPQFNAKLLTLGPDSIFDPANIADTSAAKMNKGFRMDEITNNSDRYDAGSDLKAGFVMLDHTLLKKLRLVWGARVESFNQRLHAVDYTLDTIQLDTTNVDLLPSINLTYALTEKINLRVAASRSVSRPEFRELAPFAFYDFSTSALVQGNPALKRTLINNYDLRLEFYPGAGQIISASAFYKKFKDPVEQVILPGTGGVSRSRSFQNIPEANIRGIELELRYKLNVLENLVDWKAWDYFSFYTNYALLQSEVDMSHIANAVSAVRPLQGQSPFLFNTGLQYFNPDRLFGFSVLYNVIGRRIAEVGADDYKDIYEAPKNLFDLQLTKTFFKKLEIKINVSDLLADKRILYQDVNNSGTYEKDEDNLIQSTGLGTTSSVGLSWKF